MYQFIHLLCVFILCPNPLFKQQIIGINLGRVSLIPNEILNKVVPRGWTSTKNISLKN